MFLSDRPVIYWGFPNGIIQTLARYWRCEDPVALLGVETVEKRMIINLLPSFWFNVGRTGPTLEEI